MAHVPAVASGMGLSTLFSSIPAPVVTGVTAIAKAVFSGMTTVGAMVLLQAPALPAILLPCNSLREHDLFHSNPRIARLWLRAIAVTSCAALCFSFFWKFYIPSGVPYLRIFQVHSLLIAVKGLTCPADDAIQFTQSSHVSVTSSFFLYKVINLTARAGVSLTQPLAIVCALPLIINLAHRLIKGNGFLATCNQSLQRTAGIIYSLPIAWGLSTGSFAGIAAVIAYVSLIAFSSEYADGVSVLKERFINTWYVRVRPGTNLNDPQMLAALKKRLSNLPQEHTIYFGTFKFKQPADGDVYIPEIRRSSRDDADLSLFLNVYAPCFQPLAVQGPASPHSSPEILLKLNNTEVDFTNPKQRAILRAILRTAEIVIEDPDELDDPQIQKTLREIFAWGHSCVQIPRFVKIESVSHSPSMSGRHIVNLLADGDFTNVRALERLKLLLTMSPKIIYVDASVLGGETLVSPDKIRELPNPNLLPSDWILPAAAGWVSSRSLPNGIFILDNPPKSRIALFDHSVVAERGSTPIDEKVLCDYCGVLSIDDIKKGQSPQSAEEWVPLLNAFFAKNPSTARSRAIGKTSPEVPSTWQPPSQIISLPRGQRIIEEVLQKWPKAFWSLDVLDSPQTSLEVEPGITLSWTRQQDGLIDHTGWSVTIDLQSTSAFSFDLPFTAVLDLFPYISSVRLGDCTIPAIYFKERFSVMTGRGEYISNDGSFAYIRWSVHLNVRQLNRFLNDRPEPITTLMLHGLPPFPRSQLPDWPDDMPLSALTRAALLPVDFMIGKNLKIDDGILQVLKPEIDSVITFFKIQEVLENSPAISHVSVHGFNLDRSLFTTEHLQVAIGPETMFKEQIHPIMLLVSPTLANLYSTMLVQHPKRKGAPHIVLNEENASFFVELSGYVTNPASLVLTLDNVDAWRRKAHHAGILSLEKRCDILDPTGKWHF
jgi:hypothetical protein